MLVDNNVNVFLGSTPIEAIYKGVTKVWPKPLPSAVDPYWDDVVLLVQFDDENIADASWCKTGRELLSRGDNAIVTEGPSKFGKTSYYSWDAKSYWQVTNPEGLSLHGDFTFEAWVYQTNQVESQTILASYTGNSSEAGFSFGIGASGLPYFYTTRLSATSADPISKNAWHHIAAVRKGSNMYIYVDGILKATGVLNGTFTPLVTWNYMWSLGCTTQASTVSATFQGYISEIRVTGVARYTTNFAVPTARSPVGEKRYHQPDPMVMALAHFDGAEGSQVWSEEVGNIKFPGVGSQYQNMTQTQKRFGSASLNCNSGTYPRISYLPDWQLDAHDFCIEFWFYQNDTSGSQILMGVWDNWHGWRIDATSVTGAYSKNVAGAVSNTWAQPDLKQWHHFAWSRKGFRSRVYIDGKKVSDIAYDSADQRSAITRIGGYYDSYLFHGYMDELRMTYGSSVYDADFVPPAAAFTLGTPVSDPFYDRVSCLLHMNGSNGLGSFTDETGKKVIVGSGATTTTSQAKFGTSSAKFVGPNAQLHLANNEDFGFGTGDFTIEFWAKTLSADGSPAGTMLDLRSDDGSGFSVEFYSVFVATIGIGTYQRIHGQWEADKWHHIALTRDRGVMRFFYDGVPHSDQTISYTVDFGETRSLTIGQRTDGTQTFSGYIDEVRVTKGRARYFGAYPVPNAPFSSDVVSEEPTDYMREELYERAFIDAVNKRLQPGVLYSRLFPALVRKQNGAMEYQEHNMAHTRQVGVDWTLDVGAPVISGFVWTGEIGQVLVPPQDYSVGKVTAKATFNLQAGSLKFMLRNKADHTQQTSVEIGRGVTTTTVQFNAGTGQPECVFVSDGTEPVMVSIVDLEIAAGDVTYDIGGNGSGYYRPRWGYAKDNHTKICHVDADDHFSINVDEAHMAAVGTKVSRVDDVLRVEDSTTAIIDGQKTLVTNFIPMGEVEFFCYLDRRLMPHEKKAYAKIYHLPAKPVDVDAQFSKVSLLLKMEDIGLPDETGQHLPKSIEGVTLSDTARFGEFSARFTAGKVVYGASPDFGFGAGDFTIEAWIKPLLTSTNERFICEVNGDIPWAIYMDTNNMLICSYGGKTVRANSQVTLNNWHHIQISRAGSKLYVGLNGTAQYLSGDAHQGPATVTGIDVGSAAGLTIGSALNGLHSSTMLVDEFRITKGYARYNTNYYAVPTRAFPTRES